MNKENLLKALSGIKKKAHASSKEAKFDDEVDILELLKEKKKDTGKVKSKNKIFEKLGIIDD